MRSFAAAAVIAIVIVPACGGGDDGPGRDADPGPVDPIFDDADGREAEVDFYLFDN